MMLSLDFPPLKTGHEPFRFIRLAIKVLDCVIFQTTLNICKMYFLLKPYVGTETVSWMCIVGAAPFAALGFFTYHGMTAEQFIWAWLRSEVLEPRELRFESSTLYYADAGFQQKVQPHGHGHRQGRKNELPQGQPEKHTLRVVADFSVNFDFHVRPCCA